MKTPLRLCLALLLGLPGVRALAQAPTVPATAAARPPFSVAIESLKEGAVAPDFEFADQAGRPVRLSSLAGPKALVVAVWFPTNPPAPSAFALWESWYERYRDQGVVFLSVAYNSTPEEFTRSLRMNAGHITFPTVLDPTGRVPTPSKPFAQLGPEEKKTYQEAWRVIREKTFLHHLLGDGSTGSGLFVFDGARRFIGFAELADPRQPAAIGNLLLRAGVKLAPADLPAKVWTAAETKPRASAMPAHGGVHPGDMAPDFTMQDLAGRPVKLSDYRGKVVILDFWATWCGPCQNSMPHTQEVTARYKDQGVVTLGSCTLDTRIAFERWMRTNQQKYPDIIWGHDAAEKGPDTISAGLYGVQGIPKQFIIDPRGKVVAMVTGYLKGETMLEAALAKAGVRVDPALVAKGEQDLKDRAKPR